MGKDKKKSSIVWRIIILLVIVLLAAGGYIAYNYYQKIYKPNIDLDGRETVYFYIPTGSGYVDVINLLYEEKIIIDHESFEWVADQKNYRNHVHPGKYRLKNKMNNNQLVNLLRSGEQEPVEVTFHIIRNKEQLAGQAARNLECDSASLLHLLNDPVVAEKYGFTVQSFFTMFLPNTYEFFWNTSADEFIDRMAKEYKNFWTEERKSKAADMNFTQSQIGILASIVQEETKKVDEMPRVAGVYINRLKKGMLLQADPTVIYAIGDYTIKRVLKKHLAFDSPYNTYLYTGLPPGPISLPSVVALESVLNYEKHDYIYFCAKEDFSGYHNFAKTLEQHNVNARKYQQALRNQK